MRFLIRNIAADPRILLRSSFSTTTSSTKPIRWGILSAGKISSDFAKAIGVTHGAEVHAVAARSRKSAMAFADSHKIPKSYGSYAELLANPEIDAVYIGSVADQHSKLATESLLAGKPTIVEKPLTLSFEETSNLVLLAQQKNTFLMEGMWTRCFPAMQRVKDIIAAGTIGKVVAVQGDFGWSTKDCGPDHRIWCPKAGGMTLDVGIYMAQLGQVAFPNHEVEKINAMGIKKNGVDHTVMANLRFGHDSKSAGMLHFFVTGDANTEERVVLQGQKGRIVLDPPSHVPTRVRLVTDEGRGFSKEEVFDYPLPDDSWTTWNYPGSIGFTYQVQAVGEALRRGEKECHHFTHNDSLQVASILGTVLQQVGV